MSNAINALADEFAAWDPMKEDYLNSHFNLYDCGPGANLDPMLQPCSGLAKETSAKIQPYLVFKNLPKNMTEKSLKLLCERHGKVQNILENRKALLPSTSVYFNNVSEMEAVYRALQNSKYGFHVSIGIKPEQINKRQKLMNIDRQLGKTCNIRIPSQSSSDLNVEDRTIHVSDKKPQRPKSTQNVPIDFGENCAIYENDPLKHCFQQIDSHELEREGFQLSDQTVPNISEYHYRTGRAFLNLPEKTKTFMENKHKSSDGNYNPDLKMFTKKGACKKMSKIKLCIVCNAPTDICCYRCGPEIGYCGKQCQDKDWAYHRTICGQPDVFKKYNFKTLSTHSTLNTSSINASSPKSLFPKPEMPPSNSKVVLTAVNSPSLVFIRSKERKEDIKYFQIVTKLQAASKMLEPLKAFPITGQAVIAKFKFNSEYGRALVLKSNDPDICINFLDYGNIEIVKLAELYKIPDEFIVLPRLAVPVKLKNIPKCHMTNKVRSFMYSYLHNIDLTIKYNDTEDLTDENVYQVDLFHAATSQHLNQSIAAIYQPQAPRGIDQVMTIENLKYMPMPVGDNIELVILDNSNLMVGFLTCTTKVYQVEIEGFQKDIQKYADNLEPQCYAPRQNELCVAKYSVDKKWYRGNCVEKVGDGRPTIQSIDYGTAECVPVKNIRPYPMEFDWGIFCADCGIAGLTKDENLDAKLIKRLEQLLPVGETIQVDKVERICENFYELTMHGVLKTLKEENVLL